MLSEIVSITFLFIKGRDIFVHIQRMAARKF